MTRVLVAGWSGSTNLGDELVLAGLLVRLRARGLAPTVLSVDPAGTTRDHGVPAERGSDPRAVLAAVGACDALVLGGGGLLQDETSPFNLPFHLARVAAARARRRPVVGLGLGAGRLGTRLGRTLVARALSGVPLAVRDAASADLLAGLGLARPVVAADLALALPDTDVPALDRLVVCLRPVHGRPSRLPVSVRARRAALPDDQVAATAAALDAAARATGLAVHLVALQADRDGPLQDAVAERLTTPATTARPALADVRAEVGSGRVVVSTRYHGGLCAVLAGRPAVLLGYSPKVDALAHELGAGAALLPWDPRGPQGLTSAVERVAGQQDHVVRARAALRSRESHHDEVLERLMV